jgi:hypothetical protein
VAAPAHPAAPHSVSPEDVAAARAATYDGLRARLQGAVERARACMGRALAAERRKPGSSRDPMGAGGGPSGLEETRAGLAAACEDIYAALTLTAIWQVRGNPWGVPSVNGRRGDTN